MLQSLFSNQYFLSFIIKLLATFDFLRNLIHYFDYLYIKLHKFKNYKKLILLKLQLDDSNNISFDYIYFYTLITIYKISFNDE